jgi:dihydroflavonol-4-reductase
VRGAGPTERLAVVNPGAIIGPALNDDLSFSLQAVQRLLSGDMPAAPRLGFTFVDVRDVAELHLLAMTNADAGGERFIATDEFMWMPDVAKVLRARLGDQAGKVPKRTAPDLLIRVMARFDPSIRAFVGDLGKHTWMSSEKARSALGWAPRPVEESIEETARSLL